MILPFKFEPKNNHFDNKKQTKIRYKSKSTRYKMFVKFKREKIYKWQSENCKEK